MTPPPLIIASARGIPGTVGALVRDRAGAFYLLANHHVVFGGGAAAGDPVWGIPRDCGVDPGRSAVCLGLARPGMIGRVTYDGNACFVDCALVELRSDGCFPAWLQRVMSSQAWPSRAARAESGMSVVKNGPTTGLTEGVVVDAAYPDAPCIEGREWTATDQLLVDSRDPQLNFSCRGDSGAALLNTAGCMVGLVWGATMHGQGIACPIQPVLDCLSVSLISAFPGNYA
jgi:hypothetical protein